MTASDTGPEEDRHAVNRRSAPVVLLGIAVIAAAAYGLYAKLSSGVPAGLIEVAGDVRAVENVVRAPVITYPTPDYRVGLPATSTAPASTQKRSAVTPVVSRQPMVSGFLSGVLVSQGDHVTKGQPLARLDTTLLTLGVRQAETARDRAAANVRVLDANIDTLLEARAKLVKTQADLRKTRRQLLASRAQLVASRASLETTLAGLGRQRASLEASITALEQLIGLPGGPPPHDPPYPVILQQLRGALAGLDQGIAGVRAGLAKMDAGLAQMHSGLAKIDTGLAKIASGIRKIDSGLRQLRDARELAVIARGSAGVAVDLAAAALRQATVVAPVDGTVTFTRPAGTAVMVGAPLVRIRPDGPTQVTTYLTGDQLAAVRIGGRATVDYDSNSAGPLEARIVSIGDRAVVPPTPFPTSIVHMTRAVRVTIQLEGTAAAPPGTPVDVVIRASR